VQPAESAAIDRDAELAVQIAEDLRVMEAMSPLKLTAAQMDQLLPVLDGAQAKMKQLATEKKRALADRKAALVEARAKAIQGGKPSSRLQQQLVLLQDTSDRKAKQARMDLVVTISGKLIQILSAEQANQVKTLTQSTLLSQPSALTVVSDTGDGASTKSSDLNDKIARELDRLRKAQPGPQYEMRRAGFVDQFMKGMDPNDPEYQKQLNSLFDQTGRIHEMSPDDYDQQRENLLSRLVPLRHAAMVRVQANRAAKDAESAPLQHSTGLEMFVEKVLLSPRSTPVLHEMRRSMS
jgi:hypothetical protein